MAVGNYCYESTRKWWTTKDRQGCHHLPSTTVVPCGGTQPKVTIKPRHRAYTIKSLTFAHVKARRNPKWIELATHADKGSHN